VGKQVQALPGWHSRWVGIGKQQVGHCGSLSKFAFPGEASPHKRHANCSANLLGQLAPYMKSRCLVVPRSTLIHGGAMVMVMFREIAPSTWRP
jgi:hypothetical protein